MSWHANHGTTQEDGFTGNRSRLAEAVGDMAGEAGISAHQNGGHRDGVARLPRPTGEEALTALGRTIGVNTEGGESLGKKGA